jgi:hypothetical protein
MHYTLLRRGTCFDPLDPSLESTVSPTSIHSPQQATTNYLLTSLFLRSLVMLPDQLMEYPNRMQWFCRRRKHKGPIRTTESTQDLGEPPANILLHAIARVFRALNRASPSAAGEEISSGGRSPALNRRSSPVRCPAAAPDVPWR